MAEPQVVFYECQNINNRPPFDRLAAVNGINALPDAQWRVADDNTELAVIVDEVADGTNPSHLRLLRIRADVPFVLSAARALSPVQVAASESITEFTWAVIWPDNFLGAVTSRDAPSHKKLGKYFYFANNQHTHIVNLFRPDLLERLRELERNGLRNVSVKVQTANVVQIENDARVAGFAQIFNAGKEAEAATVRVELGVGRERRRRLSDDVAAETEELAQLGDLLDAMVVKGRNDNGDIQTINMKQERLRAEIQIAPRARNIDVYREIAAARRNVEQEIGGLNRAARGN